MKNSRTPLTHRILCALFLLVLFVSGLAAAQSPGPFKATIAINETIQPIAGLPCILVGSISGTGTATHLGKITLASTDCINPMSQTTFSFAADHLVLSAANGDQVFARYAGTLTVEGIVGVIAGGYQITGGTGRYAVATGAGTIQGVEDMTTGKGQIQLIGTISY